jgi:two-component system LytT family response regulator
MLRSVIIDDEYDAVQALEAMLNRYCLNIETVGKAYSASEGIEKIKLVCPDVIFLDIEMPDKMGFDVLEAIPENKSDVIFTTAHGEYAVRAFRYSAVDYLLKPIKLDELKQAVNRISESRESNTSFDHKYDVLIQNLKKEQPEVLALPTGTGLEYILIDNILFIEAKGSYSSVFLKNKENHLVSKGLYEFQELLGEHGFFKIHKSFLINPKYIKQYIRTDSMVMMSDGTFLPISERNKPVFMLKMKQLARHFK